ncbi:unnamed protein product, partial [Brugia timori]
MRTWKKTFKSDSEEERFFKTDIFYSYLSSNNMDLISHEDENRSREITLEYLNFLDDSGDDKVYMQKCEDMIKENGSRIIINLNELRKKLPQRVNG